MWVTRQHLDGERGVKQGLNNSKPLIFPGSYYQNAIQGGHDGQWKSGIVSEGSRTIATKRTVDAGQLLTEVAEQSFLHKGKGCCSTGP